MLFRKFTVLWECGLKAEGSLGSSKGDNCSIDGQCTVCRQMSPSRLRVGVVRRERAGDLIGCSCTDPATGPAPFPGCQA